MEGRWIRAVFIGAMLEFILKIFMLGQQIVGLGGYWEDEWVFLLIADTCLVTSMGVINVGPVIFLEQRVLSMAVMSGQLFVGLKVNS